MSSQAAEPPGPPRPPVNLGLNPFSKLYVPPAQRLDMPIERRLTYCGIGSFLCGTVLGVAQGSKMAGLRFRAEHAHKLPTSTTGWYLYHKSKNYHAAMGGIKEGIIMGVKTGFWTTLMLGVEGLFDAKRGTADVFNTVVAGLATAGGFCVWNRFTIAEAGRVARLALIVSLAWGGLQDLTGIAKGRRIGYVEFVERHWHFSFSNSAKPSSDSTGIPGPQSP